MSTPPVVLLDLDPELAYYLARALGRDIAWAERVGQQVPDRVMALHLACRSKVIESQARTRQEFVASAGHDQDTPPIAVTYTEAAHRLSVSKRTIGRMIAAGELTSVKIGGSKRIPVKALDQLLRSNTDD